MSLLEVLPEDAQLEVVGFLSAPGSVPWLLASRAALPLLNILLEQRTQLCGTLRPLWCKALLWPLVWQRALAVTAWSSRATSNFAEEALARMRLSAQDEVSARVMDIMLMDWSFLHLLRLVCAGDPLVARAVSFLENSSWEVRYFVAGNRSRNGGALLLFQSGWFEGSLFIPYR